MGYRPCEDFPRTSSNQGRRPGAEPAPVLAATEGRDEAHSAPAAAVEPAPANPVPGGRGRRQSPAEPRERETREGTKQALLIAMLQRPEGATIAQVVEATGWQPHTVRGAFAGALKKKLGLTVTSEKVPGGDRVYRVSR